MSEDTEMRPEAVPAGMLGEDPRRSAEGFVDGLLKRLDDWTWSSTASWEPAHKQDVEDAITLLRAAHRRGAAHD